MDILGTMIKLLNRLNTWNLECDINTIVSYPKENTHYIDFEYKNQSYRVSYESIEPFRIKLRLANYATNRTEFVETSINCNEHDLYFFSQALTKTSEEG